MTEREVVIIDALRTPIGRYAGALSSIRPDDLMAGLLVTLNERHPAAAKVVEEVVVGATNQAGEDNRNVARMALLLAGMPYEVTGVTVNRLCGSGLEAVIQLARAIRCGDLDVGMAGGVESMSRAPYVMPKSERAYQRAAPSIFDSTLGWRFENPRLAERFELLSMGGTAERVAAQYGVSRADQDAFALQSHQKATRAWQQGAFESEVHAVEVPAFGKRAAHMVERDESVRADTSLQALGRLKPVFQQDGTVTAGNASPLNDGAAALLLASEAWAHRQGIAPLARIVSSGACGVDPNLMGIGPIGATRKALARASLDVADIDLVELNEAFAAQSLACQRELGFAAERVNVHGGAIALGHPIGCSGARITTTLVHALGRRNARYGLATLCIGVGQGLALVLERCGPAPV